MPKTCGVSPCLASAAQRVHASQTHVRTPNDTFAEDNDAFSEDEVPIILEDEDYSVSDLYFVTHPGES